MNEIKECTEKVFEDIKHIDENNNEYWLERDCGHYFAGKRVALAAGFLSA